MTSTRRKIDLYILSLGLLFVFFVIITAKFSEESFQISSWCSWAKLMLDNPIPSISILLLCYCVFAYQRFRFDLQGATDIPLEIKKIESISYEHLTFLATYVVPLISFDFESGRQMIVLALLLVVMGTIYIKTDLFYANPSLALFGFRIYRADGSFKNGNREGIILICREKLKVGQRVAYIKLDEKIYFAKGAAA